MVHDQRSALSSYVNNLLSKGRTVFTADDARSELGVEHGAFLDAAGRLQRRQALLSPRQGFYVIVPPQYASWGAPPPSWFIDPLMRYEKAPYYVGLLKAAELHGATHQAVMEFQVITSKRMAEIRTGRSLLTFYYRKELETVSQGIIHRKTDTGSMQVSSPSLTALDILRYPQASGGLDNVATVLSDLGEKIEADQLATLSKSFEKPIVQRLGHLLDWLGYQAAADGMFATLDARGSYRWVDLDRKEARDPDFAPEPVARDDRWRVVVHRHPELDE
ncbi:type IV toxin-antitoxin system AbiEi family antitoxin [Pacificimonas sp. WHA3]|jgi:predicted transcriptional regulator of viral defense system|uniref:Type IV toxin-antitoxin system AbiEi family antitoxin n=1 Tax=Pacificimonas pallii TaxID=2827236 RepID=A0ABS6SBS9_9SPHN|nr:type IV toxin-antitoxin system AbiEi family antitoxin [Pacificimonas pallii]MBV7255875.1 type IV toxin-antitoxin system AbiEi family antitoxin [Pacificimonas pallii]